MERVHQALQAIENLRQNRQSQQGSGGSGDAEASPSVTFQRLLTPPSQQEVVIDLEDDGDARMGAAERPASVPVMYEGNDTACSICSEEFAHGDRVCRLPCRHVFHTQ